MGWNICCCFVLFLLSIGVWLEILFVDEEIVIGLELIVMFLEYFGNGDSFGGIFVSFEGFSLLMLFLFGLFIIGLFRLFFGLIGGGFCIFGLKNVLIWFFGFLFLDLLFCILLFVVLIELLLFVFIGVGDLVGIRCEFLLCVWVLFDIGLCGFGEFMIGVVELKLLNFLFVIIVFVLGIFNVLLLLLSDGVVFGIEVLIVGDLEKIFVRLNFWLEEILKEIWFRSIEREIRRIIVNRRENIIFCIVECFVNFFIFELVFCWN